MLRQALSRLMLLFLANAGMSRLAAQPRQPVLPPAIASQYTLFWNDEFDGTQPDSSKWANRALGLRGAGLDSAAMVALDGAGHLNLTVQQVGSTIYSAMIGTQGRFQTTYGYFECRAMLQTASGPTSAFWLQSPTVGNPIGNPALAGDEVDIFECYTPRTGRIPQTIHWDGYGANHQFLQQMSPAIPNLAQGFHTFGLEWNPAEYVFYIDGVETFRTSTAVSARLQSSTAFPDSARPSFMITCGFLKTRVRSRRRPVRHFHPSAGLPDRMLSGLPVRPAALRLPTNGAKMKQRLPVRPAALLHLQTFKPWTPGSMMW